eukprot:13959256-Ditylum_brightwellii.AAC.1
MVTVTARFIFLRAFGQNWVQQRTLPRTESLSQMASSRKRNFTSTIRRFDTKSEPQISRRWTGWMYFDANTILCTSIGTLLGVAYSYLMLNTLGQFVVQTSTKEDHIFLETVISNLSAIGILISSALNGFGCVSLPYSCLSGLYLEDINPESVKKAEVDLQYVVKAVEEKRIALADLKQNCRSTQSERQVNVSRTFRDCCRPNAEDTTREEAVLGSVSSEIHFLETLGQEIHNDIEDMIRDQQSAAMASTLIGRIMARVGIVCSIILLVRVASAILAITQSVGTDRDSSLSMRADPVTLVLIWLIGHDVVSKE